MCPIKGLQNGRLTRPDLLSFRGGYSYANLIAKKYEPILTKYYGSPPAPINNSFRSVNKLELPQNTNNTHSNVKTWNGAIFVITL